MKWLVTAFEPFAGAQSNSSLEILRRLKVGDWKGRVDFFAPVPVEFERAWQHIRARLEAQDYGGVLALGQAESRSRISLECVALNWIDARLKDNAGHLPALGPIDPAGADLHWSNVAWEKFSSSAHCERSYSAGTYVCNCVMFQALTWAKAKGKKAGFVHIPVLQSQTDPVFEKSPRLDDEVALEETSRVIKYVVNL